MRVASASRWRVLIFGLLFVVTPTQAYIGPGLGLSAIGSLLALIGALVLTVIGFVWYPIKRLMRKLSKRKSKRERAQPASDVSKH